MKSILVIVSVMLSGLAACKKDETQSEPSANVATTSPTEENPSNPEQDTQNQNTPADPFQKEKDTRLCWIRTNVSDKTM